MASRFIKRSIHNQLVISTSPLQSRRLENCAEEKPSKDLILRKLDLLPVLTEVLLRCRPYALHIINLDVSFSIADFHLLSLLCKELVNLQVIHAKSCGLSDAQNSVAWPVKVRDLDLSRNELKVCPQGIEELMYLSKLNLSGNNIEFLPPALLRIPCLKKCLLLSNPISNIPKSVCREGVEKMRSFLAIQPLPLPQDEIREEASAACREVPSRGHDTLRKRSTSASNCGDLRQYVLRSQSSFDSGYELDHRLCFSSGSTELDHRPRSGSTSSGTSTDVESSESSDIESDPPSGKTWPAFKSSEIPEGYVPVETGQSQLCQVYLPNDCSADVEIHEVRDLSLHPRLSENELLITPVVRITPHGLRFESKPAIIVLPHCTRRSHCQPTHLVPLCSSTEQYQTPQWTSIQPHSSCEVFEDRVLFTTFHFSLFAIAASYPYPSSCMEILPGVGGELLVPELPGFSLHIPSDSIKPFSESVSVKETVYYCDRSYKASDQLALASACVGVEPHGMEFNHPVQLSVPIPDYSAIKRHFPDAKLELWCSEKFLGQANIPSSWKQVCDVDLQLERSENLEVARFTADHFSWYELLWTVCTSSLQKLGLGAASFYSQLSSRSRYVAVRFQAFMSQPCGKLGNFGLVVTVYKFGDPLSLPSNYPLLVADSGTKRFYLRAGELHVRVEGYFLACQDVEEVLERNGKILDFTGEDFCERFEFALSLKAGVLLPLQEGQVLGKLRFIQWEERTPIHKSYNLIMVGA